METITIIGTGLIGTSLGMALRKQGHFVVGFDRSEKNLEEAKKLNAFDATSHPCLPSGKSSNQANCLPARQVLQSSIVILATPVDTIIEIIPFVLDNMSSDAVLIDIGSTKKAICQKVRNHAKRNAFVAAHPMAGSETTGPQAAKPNLFVNKRVVICEPELSSQAALSKAIELFEEIGLDHIFLAPEEHDSTVALISHLPQVLAFAFASLPQFENNDFQNWSKVASSGFDSSTRLALSTPGIWMPILLQNKDCLINALRLLTQNIELFTYSLLDENTSTLIAQMERARKTRVRFEEEQAKTNQPKELTILTK
ncbi:MAG: prephenate dehydrogenase/arogenate dehydrogenase family protein [Tenuifilaceae bacterium]|jgi:prephenate dehydrogenase|nr:prephenate dehydrogenase/arogenate dehydrogenase family protein [Tenuifilaceae bacterium]